MHSHLTTLQVIHICLKKSLTTQENGEDISYLTKMSSLAKYQKESSNSSIKVQKLAHRADCSIRKSVFEMTEKTSTDSMNGR